MTTFKAPEIATTFGQLATVSDGSPITATLMREIIRNANRLATKGDVIGYAHARNLFRDSGNEIPAGVILHGLPPVVWMPLLSMPYIPAVKRQGITSVRAQVDYVLTNNSNVELFIGTTRRASPETGLANRHAQVQGTGSSANEVFSSIEVRADVGEELTLYGRHIPVDTYDSLMDTTTYGTPNQGTTGVLSDGKLTDAAASWGGTAAAANIAGAHYVEFTDTSNVVHPIAAIRAADATSLELWPPYRGPTVKDVSYSIREVGLFQLYSFAVYGEDP